MKRYPRLFKFHKILGYPDPIVRGSDINVYDWRQIRKEDIVEITITHPYQDGTGCVYERIKRKHLTNNLVTDVKGCKIVIMYLTDHRYAWFIKDINVKGPPIGSPVPA